MVRRTIALGAGALVLLALAFLPSTAGAQQYGPTTTTSVLGTSTTNSTTTTTEATTTTTEAETTTSTVGGDSVVPTTQKGPTVSGDVVSRPLPRTGSELNGTAMFGGALTVLGIALALGARRRRNAYEGS